MKEPPRREILVIVLLFLTSCARVAKVEVPEEKQTSYSYGEDLLASPSEEVPPSPNEASVSFGEISIHVQGQNDSRPEGVVIALTNSHEFEFLTDENGKARGRVPSGHYIISIPSGCSKETQTVVQTWRAPEITVKRGVVTETTAWVTWHHRYRPWPPADSSVVPYWPIGEEIRVQYFVADRCNENRRTPDVAYPTFAFGSSLLTITRPPVLRADERGRGYLYVKCERRGDPDLISYDQENPEDLVDLAKQNLGTGIQFKCK